MGILHSLSVNNIIYDKMDLRLFYFHVYGSVFRTLYQTSTMKLFKQIVYEFSRKPFLHDNFERLFLSAEPKNLFTTNFLCRPFHVMLT